MDVYREPHGTVCGTINIHGGARGSSVAGRTVLPRAGTEKETETELFGNSRGIIGSVSRFPSLTNRDRTPSDPPGLVTPDQLILTPPASPRPAPVENRDDNLGQPNVVRETIFRSWNPLFNRISTRI